MFNQSAPSFGSSPPLHSGQLEQAVAVPLAFKMDPLINSTKSIPSSASDSLAKGDR
jgi:hypothetical protein